MIEGRPGEIDAIVAYVPVLRVKTKFFWFFPKFMEFFILFFAYFDGS